MSGAIRKLAAALQNLTAGLRKEKAGIATETRQVLLSADFVQAENDALTSEVKDMKELLRIVSLTYAVETVL